MLSVIYSTKRAILSTVNGKDNMAARTFIRDFKEFLVDFLPLSTQENGDKLDSIKYQSFSFSEELLHAYCDLQNEESINNNGVPIMNYWGNILGMMMLAIGNLEDAPHSSIYGVNLVIEADPVFLTSIVPNNITNATKEMFSNTGESLGVFSQTWFDWCGNNVVGSYDNNGNLDKCYIQSHVNGKRLNMHEIINLYLYKKANENYGIAFKSNHEFNEINLNNNLIKLVENDFTAMEDPTLLYQINSEPEFIPDPI